MNRYYIVLGAALVVAACSSPAPAAEVIPTPAPFVCCDQPTPKPTPADDLSVSDASAHFATAGTAAQAILERGSAAATAYDLAGIKAVGQDLEAWSSSEASWLNNHKMPACMVSIKAQWSLTVSAYGRAGTQMVTAMDDADPSELESATASLTTGTDNLNALTAQLPELMGACS